MPKNKIYNEIISIRLSDEAFEAWHYLKNKKVSPAHFLRLGGEAMLIQKAVEFKKHVEKLPF